jgi:hypothetical protein
MRPEDCAFSIQRAHFSETGKWLTVKAPGCARETTLLLTMRVRRRREGAEHPVCSWRLAAGLWEVSPGPGGDPIAQV